ncbi:hypothetical protein [Pinibacter aurantiacus]|uniref:Lipoprotein n=1 Tax=Pinibacter aurantiacus TaxID=2851599 RepID=A0A9E2W4C5_9BACT|nr:hypothetical protein [Pinibacter aurantiacus]MBV4357318.1 hypothetical protein [Pinibacter aurantiacus]
MKVSMLFLIVPVLVLSGCMNSASDKIREFIPGTYVRQIHNEYTNGSDTLMIKLQDESAGVYLIDKMVGYQKHIDGRTFPPKHETSQWTAVYDEKLHQLIVQNQGFIIVFDPAKNQLMSNRTLYDKITKK